MKSTKKRPKSFKRLDGDPTFLIKRFIRTKSDAEQVCDWLNENCDNCSAFQPGVFLGLREAVETWDSDTNMGWHPQIGRIAEMIATDLKGRAEEDRIRDFRAVQGILTMFRAFKCAFKRQSYANVERRNSANSLAAASGVQTKGESEVCPQNQIAVEPFAPTVVWKYESERLEEPFADVTVLEYDEEVKKVLARLPADIKVVLSCFDIQISLVNIPDELESIDPPFDVPDEDGGITINVDLMEASTTWGIAEGLSRICANIVTNFAAEGSMNGYNAATYCPKVRQDKPLSDEQLEKAIREIGPVDKEWPSRKIMAEFLEEFQEIHVAIDLDDSADGFSGTLEGGSNVN